MYLCWLFLTLSNLQVWFFYLLCRVQINVSWFGKYDAFFIFHDTVFPTYPENHDTKEGFCFLNQGTKTKFFHSVKVCDFNMKRISFLLKQLGWCCLDIRFFSLILLGVSFCNSLQLYCCFSFRALIYWGLFCNYWKLFYIYLLLIITLLRPT